MRPKTAEETQVVSGKRRPAERAAQRRRGQLPLQGFLQGSLEEIVGGQTQRFIFGSSWYVSSNLSLVRKADLFERSRLSSQEQIQSLFQLEPQVSTEVVGPSDGRRCNEQLLPCRWVLPFSRPSARLFYCKTQPHLSGPNTSLPQLGETLAPHLCLPNKHLLITFHPYFPNEVLRRFIRTLPFA